jgi:hypothetical protein
VASVYQLVWTPPVPRHFTSLCFIFGSVEAPHMAQLLHSDRPYVRFIVQGHATCRALSETSPLHCLHVVLPCAPPGSHRVSPPAVGD